MGTEASCLLEVIVFDTAPGAKMEEINYMVLVMFWALQKMLIIREF